MGKGDLVSRRFRLPALPVPLLYHGDVSRKYHAIHHASEELEWTIGRLRHVIVAPLFRRAHHTSMAHGGDTNFAGTLPVGASCLMPSAAGEIPDGYGVDGGPLPTEFTERLV